MKTLFRYENDVKIVHDLININFKISFHSHLIVHLVVTSINFTVHKLIGDHFTNSLPSDIVASPSLDIFKSNLHNA